MTSLLYYQVLTKVDFCPDCGGILTAGIWNEKEQIVTCVCFGCGYNYEQLGWPSKHLKPPKERKDEIG